MCPHLHTNLQVIISLYASSVSIKDLEDPYCNSKLLSQVYLFIFGTTLNSQIPQPPCSHLVAGLRRSDKCAQRCQILWCRESIAVIDNTLRCWKANHSRSPFSSVSASRKPRGQWLEGRYSSAVNRNSLLARFAQYGALMELSAHVAELQFVANLNHYIIEKTSRGHWMIISQLLRDMFFFKCLYLLYFTKYLLMLVDLLIKW